MRLFFTRYWWAVVGLAVGGVMLALAFSSPQSNPPYITPVMTLQKSPTALSREAELTQIAINATPTPIPSATPWKIATPTSMIDATPRIIYTTNPLTGLQLSESDNLEHTPLLVKILNWPRRVRPFSKINQADIVFEYYTGGQTNQLLALFYSKDAETVGALGPGKLVDARLTRHYQADLVVSTVETMVKGVFDNTLDDRVFYQGFTPCPGICTQPVDQGGLTYADTSVIRDIARDERLQSTTTVFKVMPFSVTANDWDEVATRFSYMYADFSVMDWRYSTETGRYHLWQEVEDENGELHLTPSYDSDGVPVAFENLVFIMANYIEYNVSTYDVNLREGDPNQLAIFLRDGKLTYGNWFAETATDPFSFFVGAEPYTLKPGRTWITISSTFSRPERTAEGEYDLVFKLR
ncbi:MAG: DUF3048 C-terminal domain-containing protein [Anaerolineaceae bacterium]|nr:DUF3048 C-terminal domain-containing protein [Anaerolineaceae bacterium]MDD4042266.1 DUF3048 C-terminal domain-containing protein [Anaerolineaceae bacterium]MDD4578716.1 DUF3048 C-terminal domain-containing protein [Anaerolineaceae bacterium]